MAPAGAPVKHKAHIERAGVEGRVRTADQAVETDQRLELNRILPQGARSLLRRFCLDPMFVRSICRSGCAVDVHRMPTVWRAGGSLLLLVCKVDGSRPRGSIPPFQHVADVIDLAVELQ